MGSFHWTVRLFVVYTGSGMVEVDRQNSPKQRGHATLHTLTYTLLLQVGLLVLLRLLLSIQNAHVLDA